MFLITRNADAKLTTPSSVIKNNIETYIRKFKSFSDTISLRSGRIINIGVEFVIVPESTDSNAAEAMMESILLVTTINLIRHELTLMILL